jgi:hypothetical protein
MLRSVPKPIQTVRRLEKGEGRKASETMRQAWLELLFFAQLLTRDGKKSADDLIYDGRLGDPYRGAVAFRNNIGIITSGEDKWRSACGKCVGYRIHLSPRQVDIEHGGIDGQFPFDQFEGFFHAPGRPNHMNADLAQRGRDLVGYQELILNDQYRQSPKI